MALEDIWNGLTEEQRARARSCETPNDILALEMCQGDECVRGTEELTQAPLTDRRAAAKTLLMGPSAIGFHAVVNYSIKSSTPHAAS